MTEQITELAPGALRDQAAELPGIRAHLESQERVLAEIRAQLATIVAALQATPP